MRERDAVEKNKDENDKNVQNDAEGAVCFEDRDFNEEKVCSVNKTYPEECAEDSDCACDIHAEIGAFLFKGEECAKDKEEEEYTQDSVRNRNINIGSV